MPRQVISSTLTPSQLPPVVILKLLHVVVTKDAEHGVATVWLDYAERRNALGRNMMDDLEHAFVFLKTRFDIHVVILAGRGESFCAGFDLKGDGGKGTLVGTIFEPAPSAADEDTKSPRQRGYVNQQGRRLMRVIQELEAITIARVHGHAIGGGFGLVLACDLRVVTADALLFFPETDLGQFLPWGLAPMLAQALGPAKAKELILTCDALPPAEALGLGLVNRVVAPPAEDPQLVALDRAVNHLAYSIAAKPVEAVQGTKMQFVSMQPAVLAGDIGNLEGYMLMQSRFGARPKL
jgi:enoyl-CoA hydratase/carnithine racemase